MPSKAGVHQGIEEARNIMEGELNAVLAAKLV